MSEKIKNSRKLRDLIRIGVFSALWIAISWIIACSIGFFPPILLVMPCVLAIVGGIILVVMLSKTIINGGILVSSFLFGSCLFSMVPYGLMFIFIFAGGIIGEIIYDTLGQKSDKFKILGIIFPMLGLALGEYIPICYMQDAFKSLYESKMTSNVAEAVMGSISTPLVVIFTGATIICGYLGCFWGKKIQEKRLAKNR